MPAVGTEFDNFDKQYKVLLIFEDGLANTLDISSRFEHGIQDLSTNRLTRIARLIVASTLTPDSPHDPDRLPRIPANMGIA